MTAASELTGSSDVPEHVKYLRESITGTTGSSTDTPGTRPLLPSRSGSASLCPLASGARPSSVRPSGSTPEGASGKEKHRLTVKERKAIRKETSARGEALAAT